MPDRDHEGRREEDADEAEFHLLPGIVVAGGTQDHQPHISAVELDLRSHVLDLSVLHGQLMEVEGGAHLVEFVGLRLEQAEPDEAALLGPGGCVLE